MPRVYEEQCQLYIEQEIEEGLKQGKTPYSIGKEISVWVEKLFGRVVKPDTVRKRVERVMDNVHAELTNSNASLIPEIQVFDHGGHRDGAGRPPKYRETEEAEVVHFRARGTGENEWYTPPTYLDMVRSVLGEIQLDPASSPSAQEQVMASQFFSKEDDALDRDWFGKVFLNPPYSQPDIALFVSKLIQEVSSGNVTEAILLTHNYTDTKWFHEAESKADLLCFTLGRIRFVGSDGTIASPTQGQVFFYYGKRAHKFSEVFLQIGFVR